MNAPYVRQCLDYDPDTGMFRWKYRPREHFRCNVGFVSWNARFAGGVAGSLSRRRRVIIRIDRNPHLAHRLAWLWVHGEWPKEIDHINGKSDDNRLINLRDVSHATNCRNRQLRSDNRSGVAGVCWDKKSGKWRAYASVDDHRFNLGSFSSLDEAVAARSSASKKYDFHANHGRAAA